MVVAEQFTLALGDNLLDSLRAKCEHDARIDLFIINAQVVPSPDPPEPVQVLEQGEFFPVFTAFNITGKPLRIYDNKPA